MRAQYGERIRIYPLQRKITCGECAKAIQRDEKRYEAELRFKENYNPYWAGVNPHREYELSRLVCEQCMLKLTSPQWGMKLQPQDRIEGQENGQI